MDDLGFGLLIEALVSLVVAMVELLIFAVSAIGLLLELIFWLLLAAFGKAGAKPQRRKIVGPDWMRKRSAQVWAHLVVVGIIAVSFGGYALHEKYFKARVAFVSTNGGSPWKLKYEWVKKSGKSEPGEARSRPEYTTYLWQKVRINDPRYELQTVTLTKKNQVITLVPTLKQDLKEKAINVTGAAAMNLIGSALQRHADKKLEKETTPDAE